MNNQKYESPKLTFVSLRNEETIANTCWGYHGTGTNLYYDTDGTGWVSFQIAEGSCTLNLVNVQYYANKQDFGTTLKPSDSKYSELYEALRNSGGDSGNSYKGEGSTVIPDNPDSRWS